MATRIEVNHKVTPNGIIEVRTATITDSGGETSRTYHRHTLVPGQDLTGQHADVIASALAAWTPEVIAAYKERQANRG